MERRNHAHRMSRRELRQHGMLPERKPFRNQAHLSFRMVEGAMLADFRAQRDAREAEERRARLDRLISQDPFNQ